MKQAILATLLYGDLFDWPMTKDDIWRWLIIDNGQWTMDNGQFPKQLEKLVAEKRCGIKNGLYFLPGRENLVALRKKREKWSSEKLVKAQRITRFLKFIPWVKLIGLSGTVACGNAKKEDDIDLFIITARNRLWLTRGLVVLILSALRLYRRPNKICDMFCPNMLLDETSFKMPQNQRNLFSAHEIYQMKPLVDKNETWERFLTANIWAKKYLPNASKLTMENGQWEKEKIFNFQFSIFNYFERLARNIQLWYMRKNRTTEVATAKMIRFHPHDISQKILTEYAKRTKNLKILNS